MNTAPSLNEALIVAVLAAALVGYLFLRHRERQRRLEIMHEERMAAMQKDIPLPELRFDEPRAAAARDPREMLLHGIVWLALGGGGMLTLFFIGPRPGPPLWALPLPLALLGGGLVLYYALGRERAR
jgi:hypothetical protein